MGPQRSMDCFVVVALLGVDHSLAQDLSLTLLLVVDTLVAQRSLDCILLMLALSQSTNVCHNVYLVVALRPCRIRHYHSLDKRKTGFGDLAQKASVAHKGSSTARSVSRSFGMKN